MGKVLLYIYPGFSEFEHIIATTLLAHHHQIVTAGPSLEPVTGEGGLQCVPHVVIEQVDPAAYEAVIVPGAVDLQPLAEAPDALFAVLRQFAAAGKPVAAICGGPVALARAGLLDGRPYAVSLLEEQRQFLGFPPEGYCNLDLVQDGNLLTARGHAYAAFGIALCDMLGIFRDAQHRQRVNDFYVNGRR